MDQLFSVSGRVNDMNVDLNVEKSLRQSRVNCGKFVEYFSTCYIIVGISFKFISFVSDPIIETKLRNGNNNFIIGFIAIHINFAQLKLERFEPKIIRIMVFFFEIPFVCRYRHRMLP